MSLALTIAGTPIPAADLARGWEITRTANGRSLLRARIKSDNGSYRPALDAEVIGADGAVREFGGEITTTIERGIGGSGPGLTILTEIECHDFNDRLNRRFVTATIAAGSTVKQAAQAILPFIPGATLDAAQVNGPALPGFIWNDVPTAECVKQVCEAAGGWIGEVDAFEVFRIFEPGTIAAPFNITLENQKALGDIVVEPTREDYANFVIVKNSQFRKTAQHASYAANPREMLIVVPDETPEASVQATADTALARAIIELKRVKYPTDEDGLRPGMTQVLTYAPRSINNTFIVTDVATREIGAGHKMHHVTAIEGLVYQNGWQETWRRMGAGGSSNVVAIGTGGSTTARKVYPLGGTGLDSAETDGASWFPASGGSAAIGQNPFHVQLNTVERGTVAATVTGRIKADVAAVGVKARLYDVTTPGPVGESLLVTSITWQTVTFGVTLTPGSHFYELQLWSDTVGAWARAGGFYVE